MVPSPTVVAVPRAARNVPVARKAARGGGRRRRPGNPFPRTRTIPGLDHDVVLVDDLRTFRDPTRAHTRARTIVSAPERSGYRYRRVAAEVELVDETVRPDRGRA
jgi:hypothetical protein